MKLRIRLLIYSFLAFLLVLGYGLVTERSPQPPRPVEISNPGPLECPERTFSYEPPEESGNGWLLTNTALATSPLPPVQEFQEALCFVSKPKLNEPFSIQYIVKPLANASGSTIQSRISLPDNITVVEGKREWAGELRKDEKKTLSLRVEVSKPGFYTFKAGSRTIRDGSPDDYSQTKAKSVEVTESGTTINPSNENKWEVDQEEKDQRSFPRATNREWFDNSLEIIGDPKVGSTITVNFLKEAPPVGLGSGQESATLIFPPDAVELVSTDSGLAGQISTDLYNDQKSLKEVRWKGSVGENQATSLSVQVKILSSGEGAIWAIWQQGETNYKTHEYLYAGDTYGHVVEDRVSGDDIRPQIKLWEY
jgi:hypothetical protein